MFKITRPFTAIALSTLAMAGLFSTTTAALGNHAAAALVEQASGQAADKTAEAPWRAEIRKLAAENFNHPAWGYSHSERDYRLAKQLAAADGVQLDDDVLFAAAFLHDIAVFDKWAKEGVDHADRAAAIAGTILTDAGFDPAKVDAVNSAIRTHMYFRDPETPEAVYLHDADALDWLGAIGAVRLIALVDAKGEGAKGPDMIKGLRKNLQDVPPRVISPAAKAMLPERTAQLEAFLTQLEAQTDGLKTL